MHVRELVDTAAVVASHAPVLLCSARLIPDASIEAYWTASKIRLDRWGRALKRLSVKIQTTGLMSRSPEHRLFRGLLEEILASEVLARVWAAAMWIYDRAHVADQMEPVARSVLIGQIEARHRVLTILVGRTGLTPEESMRLETLRRRAERWADLLIGRLAMEHEVCEFAVDPDQARDFAEDFAQQLHRQGGRFAWPMVLASLQASFRDWLEPSSPNPDLNTRIAASILACFPAEAFDDLGTIPSEWTLRITHIANEAEGLLEELLADARSSPASQTDRLQPKHFGRWRFGD